MAIDSQKLVEAVRTELGHLWHDLEQARRTAYSSDVWSLACEAIEDRVKALTALVGPTPWNHVQIPLLELGIYQRIHAELGMEAPVDMEKVAAHRAYLDSTAPLS